MIHTCCHGIFFFNSTSIPSLILGFISSKNLLVIISGDERFSVGKKVMFRDVKEEEEQEICSSDESSSIGKNSDLSENSPSPEKLDEGEEVQSSYKGPLDAMEDLEEVLPIRRGISRFYNGKSKSFTSLRDASSTSSTIKDIVKPEDAYMRRKRLRGNGGGIAKRVTSSTTTATATRTTLALAVAMSSSASSCNDFSSWRSFSLADLHHCAAVAISNSNSNGIAIKPSI